MKSFYDISNNFNVITITVFSATLKAILNQFHDASNNFEIILKISYLEIKALCIQYKFQAIKYHSYVYLLHAYTSTLKLKPKTHTQLCEGVNLWHVSHINPLPHCSSWKKPLLTRWNFDNELIFPHHTYTQSQNHHDSAELHGIALRALSSPQFSLREYGQI